MLALKLGLVPALIALVTLVGRRYGPAVAGALAGFPVVSGPIFIFLVREQGRAFGVQAAIAALAGLLPFLAFALLYGWVCRRVPWWLCMPLSWLAFVLAAVALRDYRFGLLAAGAIALAVLLALPRLLPRVRIQARPTPITGGQLALRMLTAAALVTAVTHAAAAAGPQLSGAFAVFPVATSVLVGFAHAYSGSELAIALLRGMATGLLSLVAFFFVAACVLPTHGLGLSMLAALLVAVPLQMLALRAAAPKPDAVPA